MNFKMPKIPDTLIIALLLPLTVGMFSSLFTMNVPETYAQLSKPGFAPSAVLFPIVWTILYLLMGVSSYLVYHSDNPLRSKALLVYVIQLGLNFFWSILFFTLHWYLLALFWLILLIIFICIMIQLFGQSKPLAAYLQIPYFLWCLFAAVLNLTMYFMNR